MQSKGRTKKTTHGVYHSQLHDQSVNQDKGDNRLQDNVTTRSSEQSCHEGTTSESNAHGRKHPGSGARPYDLQFKTSDRIRQDRSCDYSENRSSRHQNVVPSAQLPSINRYLQEGDQEAARNRGEREGYGRGKEGMKIFLDEWTHKWNDITKKGIEETKLGPNFAVLMLADVL